MFRNFAIIVLLLIFVAALAFLLPATIYAAGPAQQAAPIENSVIPTVIQILAIVLLTEGVKSLAKVFNLADLTGKAAAIAYVVVGVLVYVTEKYLLPALPPETTGVVLDLLGVLAILLAGSGLYSMTSVFRVKRE